MAPPPQAIRLARIFTPTYARRINAQLVHPAFAHVLKPNELESALVRPMIVATYEPDRTVGYLAATFSFRLIKGAYLSPARYDVGRRMMTSVRPPCVGHPFLDGNKRTGEFAK